MDVLLFAMTLTSLICIFIIFGKLNQIEFLLRTGQAPRQPEQTNRHPAEKGKIVSGEAKQTPPAGPVRQTHPIPVPVQSSPRKPDAPKPPRGPTAWDAFRTWFLFGGNSRGNVSMEYAAATTWLIRAGILVLLCGIGFFLKYSIEKDLVSPELRICLAFLSGLAMLVGGICGIRKKFHILAVGILAAGIVVFYMGAYAGCKIYTVLPVPFCFALMILTTAASMTISAKLSLLPVALTGCTGAYLTPVLLSDGSGNLPFLCWYAVLVSAGILIVSRLHRWRSLEITAFLMSALLLASGAGSFPGKIDPLCIAAVFANFLVFSIIPVIRKKESALGLTEWLLPILSAAWGLALGFYMICEYDQFGDFEDVASAGYAVLISAIALTEGILLERVRPDGAKLQPAFLCAAVFALALAVPLALQNAGATAAGWSVLGAVLILAAAKSGRNVLVILGITVFAAALLAVLSPVSGTVYRSGIPAAFAERFFRGGVFTISLLFAAFSLRKRTEEVMRAGGNLLRRAGGLSFLIWTSVEIFYNLKIHESTYSFRHGGLSLWWAILAVLLIACGILKKFRELRIAGLALFVICIVKVYSIDIAGLNTLGKVIAFLLLGILFLGGASAYIQFRKSFSREDS